MADLGLSQGFSCSDVLEPSEKQFEMHGFRSYQLMLAPWQELE